jgi:hypothetical protein
VRPARPILARGRDQSPRIGGNISPEGRAAANDQPGAVYGRPGNDYGPGFLNNAPVSPYRWATGTPVDLPGTEFMRGLSAGQRNSGSAFAVPPGLPFERLATSLPTPVKSTSAGSARANDLIVGSEASPLLPASEAR